MPQQKLTIVPVTLQHPKNEDTSAINQAKHPSDPACTIKMGSSEISFFNGVDEHIIQTGTRQSLLK